MDGTARSKEREQNHHECNKKRSDDPSCRWFRRSRSVHHVPVLKRSTVALPLPEGYREAPSSTENDPLWPHGHARALRRARQRPRRVLHACVVVKAQRVIAQRLDHAAVADPTAPAMGDHATQLVT